MIKIYTGAKCGPSRMLRVLINGDPELFKLVVLKDINIDAAEAMGDGVNVTPLILFFDGDAVVKRLIGYTWEKEADVVKELKDWTT